MIRKLVYLSAASSLFATPIMAQSVSAQDRSSQPVDGESELAGQASYLFLAGIAVVAAAIVLLSQDDDPVSP